MKQQDFLDEVVRGLPRRIGVPVAEPEVEESHDIGSATGYYEERPRWPWIVIGALMCAPCAVALGHAISQEPPPKPLPAVTVTRTVEKPVDREVYPQSCVDAMKLITELLPDYSAISSAGTKQLDIMTDAYQAIALKDTQKINATIERQRQLRHDLSFSEEHALSSRGEVEKLVGQCTKDLK